MPDKKNIRLTISLPADAWHRLEAEAADHGKKIGPYLRALVLARDAKKNLG